MPKINSATIVKLVSMVVMAMKSGPRVAEASRLFYPILSYLPRHRMHHIYAKRRDLRRNGPGT